MGPLSWVWQLQVGWQKRQFFKFRDGTQVFSRDFLLEKCNLEGVLTKPCQMMY